MGADTSVVSDEFHFGERARRPARLGRSTTPSPLSVIDARVAWIAAGLVLAGALAFVFLRGAGEAGRGLERAETRTVATIDRAHDAAAQSSLAQAMAIARALHAERGSFATDPANLSTFDPSVRFAPGRSTGPTSIGFMATDAAFGAAVLSESGTCWWARTDATGVVTYGSGTPCTGDAALGGASAPAW